MRGRESAAAAAVWHDAEDRVVGSLDAVQRVLSYDRIQGLLVEIMQRSTSWQLALLLILALIVGTRWLVPETTGLQIELFAAEDRSGAPLRSTRAPEVSIRSAAAAWVLRLPDVFSARWTGYLVVAERGTYTFSLTSDDGSQLKIADALVVDNGGNHAARTRTGQLALERGTYPLVVEYTQSGGSAVLELLWARDEAQPAPPPRWAFSRYSISPAMVEAIRWHGRLFVPSLAALGLLIVWIMFPATLD